MKRISFYTALFFLLLNSCSTEKNAFPNRFYHGLTTRYNVYFNANEKLKSAENTLVKTHSDDYDQLLEVFPYGTEDNAKEVTPDLEIAIKKASKAIDKHSMRFKIKKKGEAKAEDREVNPFIDDSYFVLGKSYFFKREYTPAAEIFEYIAKEYHDKKIKYDALIWLVKTYIAMGKYDDARQKLDMLESDKELPKNKKAEYYAVRGQYFIKTNDRKEAINALKEAVALSKKGKNSPRWTYILAQLYLENGQNKDAIVMFKKVADASVKYEMEFNARIRMALCYTEGQSVETYVKDLLKLAKDEKNKEYLDQVHYAIAQLYLKENQKDKAEENFLLAARSSVSNPKQKALAYLALAEMNFEQSDYVAASAYYDSTMTVLPTTHPAYEKTLVKKNSLSEIVVQIEIIQIEDSLQKMAALPEELRLKKIDKLIQAIREKEDRDAEQDLLKQDAATRQTTLNEPSDENAKWYFYNPKLIAAGQAKFIGVWGSRKLEDNWRRKNKNMVAFGADGDENSAAATGSGEAGTDKKKTREYYLSALPLTDDALQASREKMLDAYYKLGILYKDNLEDLPAAIRTFEEMNKRFPQSKNTLKSYYLLYRANLKLNNVDRAAYYKGLINSEYPTSEYAALLNKKDNTLEDEQQKAIINQQYERLLNEYKKGNYSQVISDIKNINATYKKNELEAQFELLKAFAIGQIQGKEEFKKELLIVKTSYPGSDAANSANDILTGMTPNNTTINSAPEKTFALNKNEEHYFIIIADEKNNDFKALEKDVSDFSSKYYGLENLEQQSIIWNGSQKAIVIKTFRKNETSMDYYKNLSAKVLNKYPNAGNNYFPVSVTNYIALYKSKDVAKYYEFFVKEYK
ncbi:MAG: tetratricopeptide repeat protein [Flavobacteriales bacterium]